MVEYDGDLFVIGGGSGGVRAARIAAGNDRSQCTAAASNRA
jgi:pyruvate/2-oxoglutarate dehydrogenase complex dihydrolipoamide dehydrogenase (E3) component